MNPESKKITRFSHQAMSTEFEILFSGLDPAYAEHAAQAVFQETSRIESLFSRFDDSSEVSLINRIRPGETLMVGAEIFECLSLAAQIYQDTGGAFDISASTLLKYGSKFRKDYLSRRGPRLRFPVELHSSGKGFRVSLAEDFAEAGIDLGGIGKGYALDSVHGLLEDWSAENVLIHAGTSTALGLGAPDENYQGWPVGAGGPDTPRKIRLKNQALSGSGTEVKGGHIVDPETGRSAKGHRAVWVKHWSAAAADALSTAFMVMSTPEVEQYCLSHAGVESLVVSHEGDAREFDWEESS